MSTPNYQLPSPNALGTTCGVENHRRNQKFRISHSCASHSVWELEVGSWELTGSTFPES